MAAQHDDDDDKTLISSSVTIEKTVKVYPKTTSFSSSSSSSSSSCCNSQKEKPVILELSNLDRQCPLHMHLVFFYKYKYKQSYYINYNNVFENHDEDEDEYQLSLDSVFSRLKTGLEETLAIWYPAAGRLISNRNDDDDGKLNLWCNNGGAIMVKAKTKLKMSELGDLSEYKNFFEKLVYKPVFNNGDFSEFPLLVAQVTRFGCGGYSIGIGISHSLFDGVAAYHFLTAWAANNSAAIFNNQIKKLEIIQNTTNRSTDYSDSSVVHVHHHRGSLLLNDQKKKNPTNNSSALANKSATAAPAAAAIDHLYQLIMQAAAAAAGNGDGDDGRIRMTKKMSSDYVWKTFKVSRLMIQSLKNKAAAFRSSTFDVIAAHLWKARCKALSISKEKMVCLQFAVEVRSKMLPPLPKGFSGNAFVLASVALTAKQLEEESHKSIVEMIKKAKSSVDNDYVHAYKQGLEGPQTSLPTLNELTLISDWTRMPFHEIQFLHSEPELEYSYVSPLVPPILEVVYFLQNPVDNHMIDVRLGLISETVDAFSSYFLTNLQ